MADLNVPSDFKVPSDFTEKKKSGGSSHLGETEESDLDKRKSSSKEKSNESFNDFDSDQDHQDEQNMDDFDDDDYQQNTKQKVDLNAFMMDDQITADNLDEHEEEEQAVVYERGDFDDDDDQKGKHEEGEDEEEEEEEEYETDEEEGIDEGTFKTLSELANEQKSERKRKRKLVKTKKKELIREYYEELTKWDSLKFRNSVFATRIVNFMEQREEVKNKHIKMYLDEQQRLKEAEALRKLKLLEACKAMQGDEKHSKKKTKSGKKTKKATKAKKKKSRQRKKTQFVEEKIQEDQAEEEYEGEGDGEIPQFSNDTSCEAAPKYPIDELLEALEKRYPCKSDSSQSTSQENMVVPGNGAPHLYHRKCGPGRKLKRITPKTKEFSFKRMDFLREQPNSREESDLEKKKSRLMDMTLSQFGLMKQRPSQGGMIQWMETEDSGIGSSKRKKTITKVLPPRYSIKLKKSLITTTSKRIAKAKKRWGIGQEKQEENIRFDSTQVDWEHLIHFKFEFAPPRHSKHASQRIRSDFIQLLKLRHIPTSHLRWPLHVKGTDNKGGTNPFGRVLLNYTHPSHHEKGEPYVLYKILLNNISYQRINSQRLGDVHKNNLIELEEERQDLMLGVEQVLADIIEGVRMWSNFCGMTAMENFLCKQETEKFVTYVVKDYDKLMTTLVQLYSNIHSCQFALRQLAASEARGEGGDLNEFKDIMRSREKLKAEHKNVEKMLENYQVHSKDILQLTEKTDRKKFRVLLKVDAIKTDLERIVEVVKKIIEGMNFCQDLARRKHAQLSNLRGQMGIVCAPRIMKEYTKMTTKMEEEETKKFQLKHLSHALVRDMLKMAPSRS